MSFPKILALGSLVIFSAIGGIAFFKKEKSKEPEVKQKELWTNLVKDTSEIAINEDTASEDIFEFRPELVEERRKECPANVDNIDFLFNKGSFKAPFVETITYHAKVPWLKGRAAWASDYASYYKTSRHFIARSLNGCKDYFKQNVVEGDRFNVFKLDKNIEFYLVVDLFCAKMWFYAVDNDDQVVYLLKMYDVGLGRPDPEKESRLLTPTGVYSLGDKIAIYKPKMQGFYNGQKIEMIRIFGTRWIPFSEEVEGCSEAAKGYGVHGMPWVMNKEGVLEEDASSVGEYESDGCIRLATDDIEELFSVIITRPTKIELTLDYRQARLPYPKKELDQKEKR